MGIWKSIFGWRALFRWDALGAVVPGIFIAAGLSMLDVDWFPYHLLLAQICFAVAGLLCFIKIIGHAIESDDTIRSRWIFGITLSSFFIAGTVWVIYSIQMHKELVRLTAQLPPLTPPKLPNTTPTKPPDMGPSIRPQTSSEGTEIPKSKVHLQKTASVQAAPAPLPPPATVEQSPILLSARIETVSSPAIVVENLSDAIARGVTWELVLFRVSDLAFLSYVTTDIGYIKAHSTSARYSMNLENRQKFIDGGDPQIKSGEEFIGSLAIDCPECKGATYVVHFVWGTSGWICEKKDIGSKLLVPKDMTKLGRQQFVTVLQQSIPESERIPIE